MSIGILIIDIKIPLNSSLKGKRRILKSIKQKISNRFNVSIAETDNHNLWQKATFTIAKVGINKSNVNSTLSKIENYLTEKLKINIINSNIEVI
jgi:hypothetical protein